MNSNNFLAIAMPEMLRLKNDGFLYLFSAANVPFLYAVLILMHYLSNINLNEKCGNILTIACVSVLIGAGFRR